MDIKISELILGDGCYTKTICLTIDFNPYIVHIKYDNLTSFYKIEKEKYSFEKQPDFIENLYYKDNYQKLLDILTCFLGIEKRELYCTNHNSYMKINTFDFKNDSMICEHQFLGSGFNREYYIYTHYRHALKFQETYEYLFKNDFLNYRDYSNQFENIFNSLKKQKIFKSHERYEIKNATVDKFIKKLQSCITFTV